MLNLWTGVNSGVKAHVRNVFLVPINKWKKRSGKEFLMCGKQMNWKQNMVYMLREKVKLSIIL